MYDQSISMSEVLMSFLTKFGVDVNHDEFQAIFEPLEQILRIGRDNAVQFLSEDQVQEFLLIDALKTLTGKDIKKVNFLSATNPFPQRIKWLEFQKHIDLFPQMLSSGIYKLCEKYCGHPKKIFLTKFPANENGDTPELDLFAQAFETKIWDVVWNHHQINGVKTPNITRPLIENYFCEEWWNLDIKGEHNQLTRSFVLRQLKQIILCYIYYLVIGDIQSIHRLRPLLLLCDKMIPLGATDKLENSWTIVVH